MRLRRAPPARRHAAGGNAHRVDDELAVLDVSNRMSAAGRRPAAHIRMLASVHVDVTDAATLRRDDHFVLADDEMDAARIGVDAKRTSPKGAGGTRLRHD